MIGLDTNILVRYLVQDDQGQAQIAAAFIESECTKETPGFLNRIVMCELVWVLRGSYNYARQEIVRLLGLLLQTEEFQIEDQSSAHAALRSFAAGEGDFADGYLAETNRQAGCNKTVTLDRKAARLADFELLR